jgi:sporulation integral membrane protein YtvI
VEKAIADRKSFIINFIYFSIIVGLYYFVINYAFWYVFPFAFAAALAILLQNPVRKISDKMNIKAHGFVSTILVLLIVILIVGALVLGISAIVGELKEFLEFFIGQFSSLDDFLGEIENRLLNLVVALPKGIGTALSDKIVNFFENFSVKDTDFDLSMLSAPISGAWGVVKSLPSLVVGIVVTIISCVFMTSEYDIIRDMILDILSEEKGRKLCKTKNTITKGVGKLLKAYATIMIITFTEVFLGLNLMKLLGAYDGGYIVIIAFVTCIVDIIPVLGTGTVIIPWAIYSLFTGNIGLGIGLIILYGVITVLRQIIEPKLVANQVGLPSIVTIMAMFLGGRLLGAIGILAVPLTVIVLKLMYDEGIIGRKRVPVKVVKKKNN